MRDEAQWMRNCVESKHKCKVAKRSATQGLQRPLRRGGASSSRPFPEPLQRTGARCKMCKAPGYLYVSVLECLQSLAPSSEQCHPTAISVHKSSEPCGCWHRFCQLCPASCGTLPTGTAHGAERNAARFRKCRPRPQTSLPRILAAVIWSRH